MAYYSTVNTVEIVPFHVTYAQLAVVLDGFLVIFLNIVREIIDRDIVVLDVFHYLAKHSTLMKPMEKLVHAYPFFETPQFTWRERVGFTNDRDDIYTRRKTAH